MPKHTECVWRQNNLAIESGDAWALTIATVKAPDVGAAPRTIEEAQANARLIAAAPDLLLACELVKGWIEYSKIEVGPVTWIELCRALARARGEG